MCNPLITGILAIILIIVYSPGLVVTSQQPAEGALTPSAQTRYFVFIYTPGPAWLRDKPITEQPLNKHFDYMEKLEAHKKLLVGGPFKDSSGAMGIIEASTIKEANEIIENDPAVKEGVVRAEVRGWHPAVVGCIEKKVW